MKAHSFSHVGITVADFNRSVRFYTDVFGAALVGVTTDHPAERLRTFFGVDAPAPRLTIGWLRLRGGAVIEIFAFEPSLPHEQVEWNRQGITHLAINVKGTDRWYAELVARGVTIVAPPERAPRGHTFLFVADPDGNLIELIDNGRMRAVLKWLGPLGGLIFRRTVYRRYFQGSESARGVPQ